MSSPELCPGCHLSYLEEESEIVKVCTRCGFATDHVSLRGPCTLEGFSGSGSISLERKYKTRLHDHLVPKVPRDVLANMKLHLKRYPNSDQLYEQASQLFLRAVTQEDRVKHARYKSAIGVACMVTALRNAAIPALLSTMCKENSVNTRRVLRAMEEIKQSEQTCGSTVSLEGLVDNFLQSNPSIQHRKDLRDCVVKFCQLLSDLRFSGSRELLAVIGFYLAIISEDPVRLPLMKMPEFCKKYSISKTIGLDRQLTWIKPKMVILAQRILSVPGIITASREIILFGGTYCIKVHDPASPESILPWAVPGITIYNFHIHLGDVLKMRHVLMKNDWSDSEKIPDPKGKFDLASDGTIITNQMKLDMPDATIRRLRKAPHAAETPDPSFVSTSETIGEDEMGAVELSEYIRTPEELAVASKLREKVERYEGLNLT